MKPNGSDPRYETLLHCFSHLPHQILSLHEVDNATEYVLHSLCDDGCLNLTKAAYFVDNPDFDCLKGVAGFSKEDEIHTCEAVLDDAGNFRRHMNSCRYNKKVRSISVPSSRRQAESDAQLFERLAGLLGMDNPTCHRWNLKHDNFGLLIYEREPSVEGQLQEEFLHGLSILGFLPIS